jgi:hypothetical protein
MHPLAKLGAFSVLCAWALVVLLPIYWLAVTSFKTAYEVDKGPFYIPFVDFQPTLDAWRYILVELGNDTLRPYINTVIVGLSSAVIALILGRHGLRWSGFTPPSGHRLIGLPESFAFCHVTWAPSSSLRRRRVLIIPQTIIDVKRPGKQRHRPG